MKKSRDMSVNAKIGLGERLCYMLAGGGVNMDLAVAGLLLVYYTNVLGISAGVATMVIAVSKLLDGVSDLVMGHIVDRTHTKNGKARPWLLRMAIPAAVSTIAAFMVPQGWDTTAKVIYMFLTYNLSTTIGYTAVAVAFSSLNGYMTTDQKSRGLNGGFVTIINTVTNALVTATYLKLTSVFGGGEVYSPKGWIITMILYSVIFGIMILLGCLGTRERTHVQDNENVHEEKVQKEERKKEQGFLKSAKALISNKYWLICIAAVLIVFILAGLLAQSVVYFAEFVLGDVYQQATLGISLSLAMVPASIFAMVIMGKAGKRNLMLVGMLIMSVSSLLPLVAMNTLFCSISMALKGVGLGLTATPAMSIVLDTLTYGEWKNGFSMMGLGSSASSFSMKVGTSLGTVMLGGLLELGGFISGAAVQSESAVSMIKNIFVWCPCILSALCVLLLFFYDLDKLYPRIEKELREGKYAPGVKAE